MALSKRETWSWWYDTPNSHSMTRAIRAQVQTSPRNPYASAPMASSAGSKANSSAASLGVAPGWERACNPRFAFFANHLHPLPDRPRGNIQGFRDFFVGPSRVLEFHGAIPTLLFPIYVASTFFVHARSLSIMRYEGNLSMQRSINPRSDGLSDLLMSPGYY